MALTSADILVVYRSGDAESLACAEYYQQLRGLDSSQLLAVTTSTAEVLSDYATFQSQIENPVKAAVTANGYKAIVVVYHVPGGFADGSDVISTTSRLARCMHTYAKNTPNPLFDRRDMTLLDDEHLSVSLVTSRVDGPTLAAAKGMIDNAKRAMAQGGATGTFYIDPYPPSADVASSEYTDDLAEFVSRTLPLLGLNVFTTVTAEPYEDVVIPFVQNDSFVWMCGADRAGNSFFYPSTVPRFFLYNADTDSAVTVRDPSGSRWPALAIRNGYANTAGSMSVVDASHYLRPRPFFHALMSGGTVGEAFVLSNPYFDSPETLFGDPLVICGFPVLSQPPVLLSTSEATALILDELAAATAMLFRREKLADDIRYAIFHSQDLDGLFDLLYPAQDFYLSITGNTSNDLRQALVRCLSLITQQRGEAATPATFASYLNANGLKLPAILASAYNAQGFSISDSLVAEAGSWRADFALESFRDDVAVTYQFELQVASNPYFDTIILSYDSDTTPDHWLYQKEIDTFEPIPATGVPSGYSGRRIRYVGTGLTRAEAYYLRFRQKVGQTKYDWVTQKMVVST